MFNTEDFNNLREQIISPFNRKVAMRQEATKDIILLSNGLYLVGDKEIKASNKMQAFLKANEANRSIG